MSQIAGFSCSKINNEVNSLIEMGINRDQIRDNEMVPTYRIQQECLFYL